MAFAQQERLLQLDMDGAGQPRTLEMTDARWEDSWHLVRIHIQYTFNNKWVLMKIGSFNGDSLYNEVGKAIHICWYCDSKTYQGCNSFMTELSDEVSIK